VFNKKYSYPFARLNRAFGTISFGNYLRFASGGLKNPVHPVIPSKKEKLPNTWNRQKTSEFLIGYSKFDIRSLAVLPKEGGSYSFGECFFWRKNAFVR
jgi:hypothetical protein